MSDVNKALNALVDRQSEVLCGIFIELQDNVSIRASGGQIHKMEVDEAKMQRLFARYDEWIEDTRANLGDFFRAHEMQDAPYGEELLETAAERNKDITSEKGFIGFFGDQAAVRAMRKLTQNRIGSENLPNASSPSFKAVMERFSPLYASFRSQHMQWREAHLGKEGGCDVMDAIVEQAGAREGRGR